MKTIEQLINIAALGTSTTKIEQIEFPKWIKPYTDKILAQKCDNEDKFLKLLAINICSAQSGFCPEKYNETHYLPPEVKEEQNFISINNAERLVYLMNEKKSILLNHMLKIFENKKQVLPYSYIPLFVNKFLLQDNHKFLMSRMLIWKLLGNRGKWLVKVMKISDLKWDTASHENQIKMLKAMKMANIKNYLQYLEKNWHKETIKNKIDFLQNIKISDNYDLQFIENIAENDTSTKISIFAKNKIKEYNEILTPEKAEKICIDNKKIIIKYLNILTSEQLENLSYSFDVEKQNDETNFFFAHEFSVINKDKWKQNFSEKFLNFILNSPFTIKTDNFAQKISVILNSKSQYFLENYYRNNSGNINNVFVAKILVYLNIINKDFII